MHNYVMIITGTKTGKTPSKGFRVCFKLREDLKIVSGDGKTEDTAYKLDVLD